MVVDTSALVAVLLGEPEAETFADAMSGSAQVVRVSAATFLEAAIVLEARQGPDAVRDLRLLLEVVGAEVVAFDESQAHIALAAWRRFGKGRHSAGLNLGDCFSYALASSLGDTLLFKGEDFRQTDIAAATR
ncbi:MAG: type II toxin-antitoxin system VapC family toxin [Dermatophilaceae bacterium]